MKEQNNMIKSKELINKAQKALDTKKSRIAETERDLKSVVDKLENISSELTKLSGDAQDKKFTEIDGLVLRRAQLEMRLEVFKKSNQDVLEGLKQAAVAFNREIIEANKKQSDLLKQKKAIEEEYEKKLAENIESENAIQEEKFEAKQKMNSILEECGFTKEEITKFYKENGVQIVRFQYTAA